MTQRSDPTPPTPRRKARPAALSGQTPSSGFQITPQMWWALFVLVLAVWLTVTYSGLILEVLALLFGAFLLSLALRPVAAFFSQRGLPRGAAVLLIYFFLIAGVAALIGVAGSVVVGQLVLLQERAPQLLESAIAQLAAIPNLSRVIPSLDRLAEQFGQQVINVAGNVLDAVTGAGHLGISLLLVLIFGYFFTTDKNIGQALLNTWVPERYREQMDTVVHHATQRLSRWVRAQIIIVLYFGVTFGAGLAIIGVPFALLIGIIGGLLEIIPYFGGLVSVILAIIAALTIRPSLVIWVVVLYVVLTQIEANILVPNLYGRAVNVHPVLIILALVVGANVGGVFGALFSVPTVVVITALLKEFHRPVPNNTHENNSTEYAPP